MHYMRFAWVAIIMVAFVMVLSTALTAQDTAAGATDELAAPPATAAPAAGTTAAPAAKPQDSLPIMMLKAGGVIGFVIVGLSVLTIGLIVMSFVMFRHGRHIPSPVQESIEQLFKQRKVKEALDLCRSDGSLLARVIEGGLTKVRGGWPSMEAVMLDVAEEEGLRMQQHVGWFSLIAAISPMLGLLGTVWGMILVFNSIQLSGGIAGVDKFAQDIMKALVTTCFGLVVAIPNVWAYTTFRNKLDRIMMELSIVVGELMMPFKALKAAPAAAARPAAKRPAAASVAATAAKAAPADEAPAKGEETDKPEAAVEEPEEAAPEDTSEKAVPEEDAADDDAIDLTPEERTDEEESADEEKRQG